MYNLKNKYFNFYFRYINQNKKICILHYKSRIQILETNFITLKIRIIILYFVTNTVTFLFSNSQI